MAFEQRSLDDYIDVAQRIADFREKYPDGTLGPWNEQEPYKILEVEGFEKNGDVITQTFVVVVAAAYRDRNDEFPGVGMAWEIFPGRTPYTRGSELQNAETSAWGRAIIAVGASDSKRGIASREEVRNRQAEDELHTYPPNSGKAVRIKPAAVDAAVDDRWTSDAPSWAVGVDPPEDQPGTIAEAQSKQMHAVYTALGIKDRAKRLADATSVLVNAGLLPNGSPIIKSSSDLSFQQAARLLENLHERHTGKMTRR